MRTSQLLSGLLALGLTATAAAGTVRTLLVMDGKTRFEMPRGVDGLTWATSRVREYNRSLEVAALTESRPELRGLRLAEGSREYAAVRKVCEILSRDSVWNQLGEALNLGGHDEDLHLLVSFRGPRTLPLFHTHAVPGYAHVVPVDVRFLVAQGFKAADLIEALVHEAAHAGDLGLGCGGEAPEYGADGQHHGTDILSPAAAFAEGWATFVAARRNAVGPFTKMVRGEYLPPIHHENSPTEAVEVIEIDWTIHDVLSVEVAVGMVLYQLWEADGRDMTRLTAAFRDSAASGCRTLVDFLGAYTRGDGARRARAEAVLHRISFDLLPRTQVAAVAGGRMPKIGGWAPAANELGRRGVYFPTSQIVEGPEGDDLPGAEAAPAGGLMGMGD